MPECTGFKTNGFLIITVPTYALRYLSLTSWHFDALSGGVICF
jgi:hypothetical protein